MSTPYRPLIVTLALLCASPAAHAKSFQAEGSDLLIGVGAEAIALGGAMSARTDNIYAAYWNPAGLTEIDGLELTVSRQLNAEILGNNFLALGISGDYLNFAGLKSTIAVGWIPRMHTHATGAYSSNDLESIFLRFALPGLPGDFDGTIESKTKDYRLSWAVAPEDDPRWSLGLTVMRVDCATSFCGVTANDPGNYIVTSTEAVAYGFNIGAKYYYSDRLTFGINLNDIDTSLDIEVDTTYQDGSTKHERYDANLPHNLSMGVLWNYSDSVSLSADAQAIFGDYGSYQLNFLTLRTGMEISNNSLHYRLGLITPITLDAENLSDLRDDLPVPFLPTAGIGWKSKHLDIDCALYAQPIMTYQRQSVQPALDLSMTFKF